MPMRIHDNSLANTERPDTLAESRQFVPVPLDGCLYEQYRSAFSSLSPIDAKDLVKSEVPARGNHIEDVG